MKITVVAKPNSKQIYIDKISETEFVVAVREPLVQGKANRAIVEALADYFNVSKSQVTLVSGFSSRQKVFAISGV